MAWFAYGRRQLCDFLLHILLSLLLGCTLVATAPPTPDRPVLFVAQNTEAIEELEASPREAIADKSVAVENREILDSKGHFESKESAPYGEEYACLTRNLQLGVGTAYGAVTFGVPTPAACLGICRKAGPRCKAFTFVKNRLFPQTSGGSCLLLEDVYPILPVSPTIRKFIRIEGGVSNCRSGEGQALDFVPQSGCASETTCLSTQTLGIGQGRYDSRCAHVSSTNFNVTSDTDGVGEIDSLLFFCANPLLGLPCCTRCGTHSYNACPDTACGAPGIDFAGGTLIQLVHNVDTSAACRKRCRDNADCTHFFFFRSTLFAESLGGNCQLRRYPILPPEIMERQLKERHSMLLLKEEERLHRLELLEIERHKRKEERRAEKLKQRRQQFLLKSKKGKIKPEQLELIYNTEEVITDAKANDKGQTDKSENKGTEHAEGQQFESNPSSQRRLEGLTDVIEDYEQQNDELEKLRLAETNDTNDDDIVEDSTEASEDEDPREREEIAKIDQELVREFAEDDDAYFEAKRALETDEAIAILSIPLFTGVPHADPHFVKTLPGSETHFGSALCAPPVLSTTTTTTALPVVPQANYCEKVEEDFYGHDLTRRASLSSAECQQQCKYTEACIGYTFMPRQRICLLKWYLLPRPVPAFISGPRCCSDNQRTAESLHESNTSDEPFHGNASDAECLTPRPPLCLWPGKAIIGWDMGEHWTESNSAAACQRSCDRELKCDAWTFRGEPHNQCHLKRAPLDSPADIVRPLRMAASVISEVSEKLHSLLYSKPHKMTDAVANARRAVESVLPHDPVNERRQRRDAIERLSLLVPYSESISGLPDCPMFGDATSPGRRHKQLKKLLIGMELQLEEEYKRQQAAVKKRKAEGTKRQRKSSKLKKPLYLLSPGLLSRLQKRRFTGSPKTTSNAKEERKPEHSDRMDDNTKTNDSSPETISHTHIEDGLEHALFEELNT